MNPDIEKAAAKVVDAIRVAVKPLSDRIDVIERKLADPNFGAKGADGQSIQGPRGMSAFDIAVDRGFTGTVDDWLMSLHGKRGASITVGDGPPLKEGAEDDIYIDALTGEMFRCVK